MAAWLGVACTLLTLTGAQYLAGSGLYQQEVERVAAKLDNELQNHPDLEDKYFPEKYLLPVNFYREEYTTDYTMNVIFDPCRHSGFDCCKDTYGVPEFRLFETNNRSSKFGDEIFLKENGRPLDPFARCATLRRVAVVPPWWLQRERRVLSRVLTVRASVTWTWCRSRRPNDDLVLDEGCLGRFNPDVGCVERRMRRVDATLTPECWNYNDTVVAGIRCRAPFDGSILEACVELGFTQTAWIVECGGKYATDPHCGTFLEIHLPGDPTILAETRLRGQLTSGYRMTVMSTTFKGDSSRTLCVGKYEVRCRGS
jgi:hypothetical protein